MIGWILRIILFLIVLRLVLRFVHRASFQGARARSSGRGAVGRRRAPAEHAGARSGLRHLRRRARARSPPASARGTRYFCSETSAARRYGKHA